MKKITTFFVFLLGLGLSQSLSAQDRIVGDTSDKPFLYVEQAPEFPGGMDSLSRFLGDNIQYPILAKEKGVQGKILIRFVVDVTGRMKNQEVIKSDCYTLEKNVKVPVNDAEVCQALVAEAMRVMSRLAAQTTWKPGRQNGKPVSVYYTLPIKFVLE